LLEHPPGDSDQLTIYALLESASITGAYRFLIAPAPTTIMDGDAALYPRKKIRRLGVAPLTSMYQHGENDRRMANDWRPEIHDSDGLALFTGGGEWIWRPWVNPAGVRVNSYFDNDPRGFGLCQRDRNFDHYQDAHYDRRPSLWVEPRIDTTGSWFHFPHWGVRTLPIIGGIAATALTAYLIAMAGTDMSLWPVVLGMGIFLYMWWLFALLFDLVFVWHRYIRHAVGMQVLRQGYKDTGTVTSEQA
jgi:hypothetical protein